MHHTLVSHMELEPLKYVYELNEWGFKSIIQLTGEKNNHFIGESWDSISLTVFHRHSNKIISSCFEVYVYYY